MTKIKTGRPAKYGEETKMYHVRVPIGAMAGLDKLVKQYIQVYMEQKAIKAMKKKT